MKDTQTKQTERDSHWDELHIQLQDLLAGYVDNMLNEQESSIIEAHLAGCDACRADIARQEVLMHRLSELPVTRIPTQLQKVLDQSIEGAISEQIEKRDKQPKETAFIQTLWSALSWRGIAMGGWGVAFALLLVMLFPDWNYTNQLTVPMVEDVVTHYREMDNVPFPTSKEAIDKSPPVTWPDARVLASWKTKIGGADADAFAVRTGNKIVLQFRVDETVFFHNPAVRNAIANQGDYRSTNNELEVLALPLKDAGLLMVGPVGGLPDIDDIDMKPI